MTDCLRLEGFAAGYREVIVSDVELTSQAGEVVAIVGVNGAGKSTILKTIMGEAKVHAGRVMFEDSDVTGKSGDFLSRRGVGYVPQLDDVFPGLSVWENLRMGGYLLPRSEVRARIDRAFEQFPQLAAKRRVAAHKLSGGERKQVALSRALMLDPRLLLLDEPTSNLSPNLATELLDVYLPQLAALGISIVIVEQRVEAVLRVAHRACLIGGGRMIRVGEADEMLDAVRTHGLMVEAMGRPQAPTETGRIVGE